MSDSYVINVELFSDGKADKIATIYLNSANKPMVSKIENQKQKELQRLLDEEIRDSQLLLHTKPNTGVIGGKRFISDRVIVCSPGQEGYVYALAHELSNHRLLGSTIRGIVKKDKAVKCEKTSKFQAT